MVIFLFFYLFSFISPYCKKGGPGQGEGDSCQNFFDTCVFLWSIGTRKHADHFEFPKEVFFGMV